jgi:AcrR family transcriptional regulator
MTDGQSFVGQGNMVIRQRAIQAVDKKERRHAILDAAERMFINYPDRLANVSEVADAAGLAKGTVYLYFPSKEELLLALHERNSDRFFSVLIERLEHGEPVTIDDVLAITHERMVRSPTYLPLAGMCFGMMEKSISAEAATGFHERMAERLVRAGAGLERHFPRLKHGQGVMLLMHSYGLIIGLWQLAQKGQEHDLDPANRNLDVFRWDYAAQLDDALRALWAGSVEDSAGAAPARQTNAAASVRSKRK